MMSYRYHASTNGWQPPSEASTALRAAAFMVDTFLAIMLWVGISLLFIEPLVYLSMCFILLALMSPGKRFFRLRVVRAVDGCDAAMTQKACRRILALFSVPFILISGPIKFSVHQTYRPFYDQILGVTVVRQSRGTETIGARLC